MIPRFIEGRLTSAASGAPRSSKVALVEDYRLEEALRQTGRADGPRRPYAGRPRKDVTWRQIVQYCASYIVSDYFSLDPSQRSAAAVERAAGQRWTNRVSKFESTAHFRRIRHQTVVHLSRFLQEGREIMPMVLFERLLQHIPAIEADLAFHMQVLYRTAGGRNAPYVVQKYVVDDDPGFVAGFRHMAALFCMEAFGSLPGRIEIFGILSGNRYVYRPRVEELSKSVAYLQLFQDDLPETERLGRRAMACGACSLSDECDRTEEPGPAARPVLH